MNHDYPYSRQMIRAAAFALMNDVNVEERFNERCKNEAIERLHDAMNDLLEAKWPTGREDDRLFFSPSRGNKDYVTTHCNCSCIASLKGNLCRHRARRRIVLLLEAEYLPKIEEEVARQLEAPKRRVSTAQAEREALEMWSQ